MKMVEVEWLDSVVLWDGAWAVREDIEAEIDAPTMTQRTVGYVLRRDKLALVLAQSMQMDDDCSEDRRRFAGVLLIPAKAVLSVNPVS